MMGANHNLLISLVLSSLILYQSALVCANPNGISKGGFEIMINNQDSDETIGKLTNADNGGDDFVYGYYDNMLIQKDTSRRPMFNKIGQNEELKVRVAIGESIEALEYFQEQEEENRANKLSKHHSPDKDSSGDVNRGSSPLEEIPFSDSTVKVWVKNSTDIPLFVKRNKELQSSFVKSLTAGNTEPAGPSIGGASVAEFSIAMRLLILSSDVAGYDLGLPQKVCNGWGIQCTSVSTIISNSNGQGSRPIDNLAKILYDANGNPLYYGIVMTTYDLPYDDGTKWATSLTPENWAVLTNYCKSYGVRIVSLQSTPANDRESLVGDPNIPGTSEDAHLVFNLESPVLDQLKTNINTSARMKIGVINEFFKPSYWYSPAYINPESTGVYPYLYIEPVANPATLWIGAYLKTTSDGREELHQVITSNDISHHSFALADIWLTWVTKGIIAGKRRVLLSTQVDDVFLQTDVYLSPLATENIQSIVQFGGEHYSNLSEYIYKERSRLPAGSTYTAEMAFNGYGFYTPIAGDFTRWNQLWAFRDNFYWLTHTMTHIDMNCNASNCLRNGVATQTDIEYEIMASQWFTEKVLYAYSVVDGQYVKTPEAELKDPITFSKKSIVTPGITGLNNTNAVGGMLGTGIFNAVGDTSRKDLKPTNVYHPFRSNAKSMQGETLNILPRFPTRIYFDAYTSQDAAIEFNDMFGPNCYGSTMSAPVAPPFKCNSTSIKYEKTLTFEDMLVLDSYEVVRNLMNYRADPYMFHQPNIVFYPDATSPTGSSCLLCRWITAIFDIYLQYSNLPIITYKMDDLSDYFLDRAEVDTCGVSPWLTYKNGVPTDVNLFATGHCRVKLTQTPTYGSLQIRFADESDLLIYGPDKTKIIEISNNGSIRVPLITSS